jgi:hypothetical protein
MLRDLHSKGRTLAAHRELLQHLVPPRFSRLDEMCRCDGRTDVLVELSEGQRKEQIRR